MNEQAYLNDCLMQFKKLKTQADRSIAQITDEHFFAVLDPESNSIAILMKHVAGNMKSRWTDFLISDGEKPNRDRDNEFEISASDSKSAVRAAWEEGWACTLNAVSTLTPNDLDKTVTVLGEAHSVFQAINRQLTHYAAHVGQIVFLAKHFAGSNWQTLTIPRGKSKVCETPKQ
ncbi:MAG: DUF1572 family protein [Bacteriovoracaceae bacterium]